MKKLILFVGIMLCVVSCRDNTTFMYNPDDYTHMVQSDTTMESQLLAIWEGINTSYVFWSVDTVDWDARRDQFIDVGRRIDAGEFEAMPVMNRYLAIFNELDKLFVGLVDSHMAIFVIDPYVNDHPGSPNFWMISPSNTRVYHRPGYHVSARVSEQWNYLKAMNTANVLKCDSLKYATDTVGDNKGLEICSAILDGGIAYIRMSGYALTLMDHSAEVFDAFGSYFNNIKQLHAAGKLKGIILDNRGNGGGAADDNNYVIGLYISEPVTLVNCRTKNGLNRYDYTPWSPMVIQPQTESPYYVGQLDVPYVALHDANSVSMGEITSHGISLLKNGMTIGECTWGAHGPLEPDCYAKTYTGSFNFGSGLVDNKIRGHLVYTSTWQSEMWDRETNSYVCKEGVGVTPQIECALDTALLHKQNIDNQLLRAIEYIESK